MKRIALLLGVFGAIAVGFEVAGLLAAKAHYGGFWNSVPLWDLAFGIVGGGLLAFVARGVLKPRLARAEDHYDEGAGG